MECQTEPSLQETRETREERLNDTEQEEQVVSLETLHEIAAGISDDDPRLWEDDPFDEVVVDTNGYRIKGSYMHENVAEWNERTQPISAKVTEDQRRKAIERATEKRAGAINTLLEPHNASSADHASGDTKDEGLRSGTLGLDEGEVQFYAEAFGVSEKVARMLVRAMKEQGSQSLTDQESVTKQVEALIAAALTSEMSGGEVSHGDEKDEAQNESRNDSTDAHAEPTNTESATSTTDNAKNSSPLQSLTQLIQAVRNRDTPALMAALRMVENHPGGTMYYVNMVHPAFGRSPLMLAAELGSVEHCLILLSAGADPCETLPSDDLSIGDDSIACASRHGHESLALLLLEASMKYSHMFPDAVRSVRRGAGKQMESMEQAMLQAQAQRAVDVAPEAIKSDHIGEEDQEGAEGISVEERLKTYAEIRARTREVEQDAAAQSERDILGSPDQNPVQKELGLTSGKAGALDLMSETALEDEAEDHDDGKETKSVPEQSGAEAAEAQSTKAPVAKEGAVAADRSQQLRPALKHELYHNHMHYPNAHLRDKEGFTLAMNAVYRGQLRLARALVRSGTPIDAQGKHGETLASLLREHAGLSVEEFVQDKMPQLL